MRTEPIISAWCAVAQLGEQSYNRVASSSLARILPKNCNLRKSFSPINSCVNGIHGCSSQPHAIGCMLRQHPSLRRSRPSRYRWAAFKENGMISNELLIGKTEKGTYYVRPLNWAGQWDKDGRLIYGNVLFESYAEGEAQAYASGFEAGRNWK